MSKRERGNEVKTTSRCLTSEAHYRELWRALIDNLTDEQTAVLENHEADPEAARRVLEAAQQAARQKVAELDKLAQAMTTTCGFDWCNDDKLGHKEHVWTDGLTVTERTGRTRRVYTYTSIQEGFAEPVLIGVEDPDDECSGMEAWLSIEDAEYLRDALTTAIDNAKQGHTMTADAEKKPTCTTWCTDVHLDGACWGNEHPVAFTLEEGYPADVIPDLGFFSEFDPPRIAAYPYRREVGCQEILYLHCYRPSGNKHIDLDTSLKVTVPEARALAQALIAAADEIEGQDERLGR